MVSARWEKLSQSRYGAVAVVAQDALCCASHGEAPRPAPGSAKMRLQRPSPRPASPRRGADATCSSPPADAS